MTEVYEDWADELGCFTLAAINHGVNLAKREKHPPSQGEFMAYCRTYRHIGNVMIEHKISEEQRQKNIQRIHELVSSLAKGKIIG